MIRILRNMSRRKVRTGLTMFGIAIGVFALTVMGAMSENFALLLDGAERLSSRNIDISPATRSADDRLTRSTITALRQVEGVRAVSNSIGGLLTDDEINVSFGPPAQVSAVDPIYVLDIFGTIPLQAGRWIEPGDGRAMVLGSKLAATRKLGVGSTLTWRKNDYTVVGIMADTNTFPDNMAIVPFEVARRDLKLATTVVGALTVIPEPGVDPEEVAARINRELPKVRARSPRQAIDEIRQQLVIFNVIMLGGAALAAVVGGLAVVNTMIMSVNERTREIGIKKALGAENRTIIREYLSEAAMIGLLGGIAGVWFGWAVANLLNVVVAGSLGGSNVWAVTPRLVVWVMSFAVGLGVVAGLYPAWSAARLDPVQALRSE